MNYLKNILTQLEDLTGFKDIVGASEEIASMKMRQIRNKVLLSRDVNNELTEIYREVSLSYKNQIIQIMQQQKGNKAFKKVSDSQMSLKTGNGKHACVYLSANSGLFSNILEKTYYEFIAYLQDHKEAIPVIIGEFGKKLYTNDYPKNPFIYYALTEDKTTESIMKQITEDLSKYSSVVIFFAKFESMVSQRATVLDVSGEDTLNPDVTKAENQIVTPTTHYLFEPSLEKIILFFEMEIFAGIIQQTVTESNLARYASRITTLDKARENIDLQLRRNSLEKRFAMHRLMNKKQTEAITGISLWKLT